LLLPEPLLTLGIGILLGASIAAPPGPINATIATQVGIRSWWAGLSVGLGAITADAIFFLLTYFGLANLVLHDALNTTLFLIGGMIMLLMAYHTLRSVDLRVRMKTDKQTEFPYLLGLSIGITNPFQIAWWITVGISVVSTYGLRMLLGFFIGVTAWVLAYASILTFGIAKHESFYHVVIYSSTIALGAFGLWFLFTALTRIVQAFFILVE
jgi:threonine/homoserine/homoserine lactone efflux protein